MTNRTKGIRLRTIVCKLVVGIKTNKPAWKKSNSSIGGKMQRLIHPVQDLGLVSVYFIQRPRPNKACSAPRVKTPNTSPRY